MKIYLVRHAQPKPADEDPEKSLSDVGVDQARRVADYLRSSTDARVKVILHSGKARAQGTAEILATAFEPQPRVMPANGLDPNADVSVWVDRALLMEEDVMLVGHLPHLGNLASCLVHRDESQEVVRFSPATLLCLERDRDGQWSEQMVVKAEDL